MFEIVGDEIRFDGDTVAVIKPGVLATVRARVEDALQSYVDPDEIEEDHSGCVDKCDYDTLEEERDAAEAKRDFYAAMLGIKE
jgi:hypothetical protein